jgi:hypothetical protein
MESLRGQLASLSRPMEVDDSSPLLVASCHQAERVASSTRAPRANAVGLAMKSVGKPDAGNPHVR